MKKMRKNMCLLLAVLMMAGTLLIGCDEVPPEDVPTNETAPSGGNETPSPTQNPEEESAPDATQMTYEEALSCLAQGKTEEAYALFLSIPEYRDVSEHLERFVYHYGKQVTYSRFSGNTLSGHTLIEYQYNQYGQQTEWINRSQPYSFSRKIYDSKGNCLRELLSYGNEIRYTYDDKGNVVKKENYQGSSDKVAYYDTYSYDEQGHVIERCYYEDDMLLHKYLYAYDEAGNQIERVELIGDVEQYRYEYTYDEAGNRLTERYATDDGWRLFEYEYNAQNKMIRETCTSSWSIGYETRMAYDDHGNITRHERTDRDSQAASWWVYEYTNVYDEHGRLIKITTVMDSELYSVKSYEYDEKGNLVRYMLHEYSAGVIVDYFIYDYLQYQLYYDPFIGYVDPLADIDFGGK